VPVLVAGVLLLEQAPLPSAKMDADAAIVATARILRLILVTS
jgi:hypothetical protein